MIKKLHKTKIGVFSLMEETGNISGFKCWYNILPTKWFDTKISQRRIDLINKINSKESIDLDNHIIKYELQKNIELNLLQAYDVLVTSLLTSRVQIMIMKGKLKSRKLRKITNKPDIFKYCIGKIKETTNIDIVDVEDIVKFKEYVATKHDRLTEYYAKKNNKSNVDNGESKLKTLVETAYSYLLYLNYPIENIDNMKIYNYLKLQNIAIEKMKAEKALALKNKEK